LVEVEDRNGRIVQYDYDGRLLVSETWVENNVPVREITYEYAASPLGGTTGLVSQIYDTGPDHNTSTTDDIVYSYAYDGRGRLELSEMQIGGLDVSVEVLKGYDLGDRLIGTQFSVDSSLGNWVDHENHYAYDRAGRMASVTQTGSAAFDKHVEFAYNRAGQFTAIERYAASTASNPVANTKMFYDPQGRVNAITHVSVTPVSNFAEAHFYEYDDANRLMSHARLNGNDDAIYSYDDLGQLTDADRTGATSDEAYVYDENGNRVTVGSQAITTGPANQLADDGTFAYFYDNEGNLIQRTRLSSYYATDKVTQYTWDHRNRLTKVTISDSYWNITQQIDYTYDAFNQLIKRVEDPDGVGTTAAIDQTFFLYDQGQVALEFHQAGSGNLDADDLSHRYLWGPAVDQLLADEQIGSTSSETLWALTDHLGSVRDVVDSNGDQRIHRAFDSFGNVTSETHYDASGNNVSAGQTGYVDVAFEFTGRYFDDTTGLQNNLNRWYDPTTGRWINEDPIGFDAGDPNLYRYVGNAPTMYNDPTGQYMSGNPYWPWWPPSQQPQPEPEPPGGPPPGLTGEPWRFCPDEQNPRGGVYRPKDWKGPNPPNISWDPGPPGHWDYDDGTGTRRRVDRNGNPISDQDAHPGNLGSACAAAATVVGGGILWWLGSGIWVFTPWPDPA
jgi:RHS repeat-associated protein